MLKPDLAEYVVVHELAHLRVRNHSPEFWDLLSRACPTPRSAAAGCGRWARPFHYDGCPLVFLPGCCPIGLAMIAQIFGFCSSHAQPDVPVGGAD